MFKCKFLWSATEALPRTNHEDMRQETANFCRYCVRVMRNKIQLGDHLACGKCEFMDRSMNPFPVFTNVDSHWITVEVFRKHRIQSPVAWLSARVGRWDQCWQRGRLREQGKVCGTLTVMTTTMAPTAATRSSHKLALRLLYPRSPVPSLLPLRCLHLENGLQPIEAFNDNDGTQTPRISTPRAKKNCAEQVQRPRHTPCSNTVLVGQR